MTKPKPRPARPVDAVRLAIERETAKRPDDLKPIEIVKITISAYQVHASSTEDALPERANRIESADRTGLRRGTQAACDRLLFNANYWLAAYEDRIVDACEGLPAEDVEALLKKVAVWNSHTLRLNTLPPEETTATFERFCPPFALNNRRGSDARTGAGTGPVPDFAKEAAEVAEKHPACATALQGIVDDMRAEAAAYDALGTTGALDALFAILPAWCLQDRIPLVSGNWLNDGDVTTLMAEALHRSFLRQGYGEAPCRYFLDSCRESIDAYQRDITTEQTRYSQMEIGQLIGMVHNAREAHPDFEENGYGDTLPAWLISKEQLIWNLLACALYGPTSARPLLVDSPGMLANPDGAVRSDVITDLARTSFSRYTADRAGTQVGQEYESFTDQPEDLRNSSIQHIRSIPGKLDVLGYEIMPLGSCYPEQRITKLTASETECLAILEHRRWLAERTEAGWTYAATKDVEAKTSPYLVPWEDLPDRAREWNRSAVRNIPSLLAGQNLAIVRCR